MVVGRGEHNVYLPCHLVRKSCFDIFHSVRGDALLRSHVKQHAFSLVKDLFTLAVTVQQVGN